MAKILLVEDDDKIARSLLDLWRKERHNVDLAPTLADAGLFLERFNYDVVVLDWELPDGHGVSLLGYLGKQAHKPRVLMLTARSGIADKITGLDSGADDYLAKPFEFDELAARLRSLLKRERTASSLLELHGISVDPQAHKVFVCGSEVRIAPRDFKLLLYLVESGGSAVSQDVLLREIFGSAAEDAKNALLCSVSRLRSNLKKGGSQAIIEYSRDSGYRLSG
ncbi:MAG: response regulator transcription factor [Candidatus Obscuribacterales bacterium]|nr:response regulator transcription factor [Candidatus Obscuribacterales bacterium]